MENTGLKVTSYKESPLAEMAKIKDHGRISDEDAQLLLYLSRMSNGDIVEIGCHTGQTTRMLAAGNPDKYIIGIDWSGSPTMNDFQVSEHLPAKSVGESARGIYNIQILDMVSWGFKFPSTTGMVFVDGDHSARGLILDFANIISQLESGIVVFHDYYASAPEWCAVNAFVNGFLSYHFLVNHITGTNCTWIEL